MSLRMLAVASLLVGFLTPAGVSAQSIQEGHGEHLVTRIRPAPSQQPDLAAAAELIIQQTNTFRKEQDRSALNVNAQLTEAARYFADYLARTNKFSHTADGNQPWDRTRKFGYAHCIIAENIAYEYDSAGFSTERLAAKLLEGWEHSPGHRKNLLDPDLTEIGVALARSPETGYYYAVQDFGRPESLRLEFKVTNDADATIKYQLGERTFPLPPGYTRAHQTCRPAPVIFRWPGESDSLTLRPARGDHLDVTRDGARKFQVKKE
jgi:uncharacterized protein YkwD